MGSLIDLLRSFFKTEDVVCVIFSYYCSSVIERRPKVRGGTSLKDLYWNNSLFFDYLKIDLLQDRKNQGADHKPFVSLHIGPSSSSSGSQVLSRLFNITGSQILSPLLNKIAPYLPSEWIGKKVTVHTTYHKSQGEAIFQMASYVTSLDDADSEILGPICCCAECRKRPQYRYWHLGSVVCIQNSLFPH